MKGLGCDPQAAAVPWHPHGRLGCRVPGWGAEAASVSLNGSVPSGEAGHNPGTCHPLSCTVRLSPALSLLFCLPPAEFFMPP